MTDPQIDAALLERAQQAEQERDELRRHMQVFIDDRDLAYQRERAAVAELARVVGVAPAPPAEPAAGSHVYQRSMSMLHSTLCAECDLDEDDPIHQRAGVLGEPAPAGICGVTTSLLVDDGDLWPCEYPAGHEGWHQSGNGMRFMERGPAAGPAPVQPPTEPAAIDTAAIRKDWGGGRNTASRLCDEIDRLRAANAELVAELAMQEDRTTAAINKWQRADAAFTAEVDSNVRLLARAERAEARIAELVAENARLTAERDHYLAAHYKHVLERDAMQPVIDAALVWHRGENGAVALRAACTAYRAGAQPEPEPAVHCEHAKCYQAARRELRLVGEAEQRLLHDCCGGHNCVEPSAGAAPEPPPAAVTPAAIDVTKHGVRPENSGEDNSAAMQRILDSFPDAPSVGAAVTWEKLAEVATRNQNLAKNGEHWRRWNWFADELRRMAGESDGR